MRVTMLAAGTRGDVQPVVALADELTRRGHDVRVASSPNTLDLVRGAGLAATPLGPDTQAINENEANQRALAKGNARAYSKALLDEVGLAWDATVREILDACEHTDAVIATPLVADMASVATDLRGLTLHALHPWPTMPNRSFPHPMLTTRPVPRALNRLTGDLFMELWWRTLRERVERSRHEVGLPPAGRSLHRRWAGVALQTVDPALVPGLDMGPRFPITGALGPSGRLRQALGDRFDPDLEAWLDAGEPPVYFGFGSMPVRHPDAAVALIVSAARTLGRRALISSGWSQMAAAPIGDRADDVRLVTGALDHAHVFGRCAAAVHHGGAGTTHATAAAGLPTVVCSVLSDQPFWGAQLTRLGTGRTFPFPRLTEERLVAALRAVLSSGVAERARAIASSMVPTDAANAHAADAMEEAIGREAA